jgi:hypothetical protein
MLAPVPAVYLVLDRVSLAIELLARLVVRGPMEWWARRHRLLWDIAATQTERVADAAMKLDLLVNGRRADQCRQHLTRFPLQDVHPPCASCRGYLTAALVPDEVELLPGIVEQLLQHLVRIVLVEQRWRRTKSRSASRCLLRRARFSARCTSSTGHRARRLPDSVGWG